MRKRILIAGSILILLITVIIILWQSYTGSPDYNYLTAKVDIKKGHARIINIGFRRASSKDKEIDMVTAKYGFENVFIGYDTTKQKIKGIKNYNEIAESYLALRNGPAWRINYQQEIDSLYKAATMEARNKK
ncbi:MAG: hypothetical protein ABIN74_15390 [Ferruginibacter sp.]